MSEQSSVREALEKALQDGLRALKDALDLPALEALRNTYLSKKGIFTAHMQELAKARAEERPQLGKIINDAKTHFQQALQEKIDTFRAREMAEKLAAERVDVTLAGRQTFQGGLHPVTLTRRRIEDWFARLGFVVEDGPEIEDDFHNFTALNIPEHHPARAMQDTFYFDPKTVLRTHTSGVQIRTMERDGAPLRIVAPGRVYRSDLDATHSPMFHQIEGLVVDGHSTFADLKGTLELTATANTRIGQDRGGGELRGRSGHGFLLGCATRSACAGSPAPCRRVDGDALRRAFRGTMPGTAAGQASLP